MMILFCIGTATLQQQQGLRGHAQQALQQGHQTQGPQIMQGPAMIEPGLPQPSIQGPGQLPPYQYPQGTAVPFHLLNRRDRAEIERQLYWGKTTYRAADALFPNYALNYPAPIHHHPQYQGSISPSIQYPEVMPPRYEEALLMPGPTPPMVHHGTHAGTPLQVGLPHPSTPVNGGGTTVTTPLATSSPPIDRSQPNVIGSQHSLGLPFTTSTRTSLHDYENMRYPASSSSSGMQYILFTKLNNHRL